MEIDCCSVGVTMVEQSLLTCAGVEAALTTFIVSTLVRTQYMFLTQEYMKLLMKPKMRGDHHTCFPCKAIDTEDGDGNEDEDEEDKEDISYEDGNPGGNKNGPEGQENANEEDDQDDNDDDEANEDDDDDDEANEGGDDEEEEEVVEEEEEEEEDEEEEEEEEEETLQPPKKRKK